ncbi:MAG TPA: MFS transporter [Acidimicrobiales bacterium]|nr:MFS transporter [Acidimicrobiales bacterium]
MAGRRKQAHHQVTFAVLAAAAGGYALLQSLVVPVLPTIQAGLHTSQNTVTWVLTAYLLSASVCTPIVGRLGDMWGKERFLVVTLVALAVGSLLGALAGNITVMIVARVIQGVGGGVMPLSFGIVRDEFPRERVVGAVGIIAALAAAGAGLGIVLAGPIVGALDYHWLFWLPMIVVSAAAVAAHFFVPESPVRAPGRISWPGVLLLSGWLVALMLGVSEAPAWGWGSAQVIGLVVGGLVLAGVWVVVESRSPSPLVDMRLMRLPTVWTTNLVALLFGVGMYAVLAFLPELVQTPASAGYGFGASITESGLMVLPLSILMFAFGILSGPLSRRYGAKAVLVVGAAISAASFVLLATATGHKWEIVVAMTIEGIGFGLAFSAMSSLVVEGVPAEHTGVASGMNANIRTIGGSIGTAVMSSIVTAGVRSGSFPPKSGYTNGFTMLAVVTVAAALAAVVVPNIRPAAQVEELHHAELGLLAGGTLAGDEPE